MLAGRGYSSIDGSGHPAPIVLWPPGYSASLWVVGQFGLDPPIGARALNLLLLVANLVAVTAIVAGHSGRSSKAVPAAAVLLFSSPALISAHAWAWSEPLYLLLIFGSLWLLNGYLRFGNRLQLVGAGLMAGGAVLTRYVGISWVAAGAAGLWLWDRRRAVGRALAVGIFGLPSLAGLLLWLGRNLAASGSLASRPLRFHRLYSVHFLPAVENLGRWIFPTTDDPRIQTIGLTVLGLTWAYLSLRYVRSVDLRSGRSADQTGGPSRIPELCVLATIGYLGALVSSKFLTDPQLPLDQRLFLPALALLVIGLVCATQRLWTSGGRSIGIFGVLAVGGVMLAGSVVESFRFTANASTDGLGYNSVSWQQSELVRYADRLAPGVRIYSNADDGLNFRTGRPVYPVPEAYGVAYGQSEQDFFREIGEMKRDMAGGAALVYFDAVTWRLSASIADLRESLPLITLFRADEGAVYGYDG